MASPSTEPEPGAGTRTAEHTRLLHGWGATHPTSARVVHPSSPHALSQALADVGPRGAIARGLGRSYGDAAQNAGGRVVETTGVADFDLDPVAGVVRASAGASLDDLLRELVPLGWFVPVSPGTRYVTVGGAIAADIHGKNHHRSGSWCNHVERMTLALPNGDRVTVGPTDDPDLFWATAGGMGLTGVILEATFRCLPIETSQLIVDTDRTPDLDSVMALMEEGDADYDFSVAWVDLMTRGASMGRSVLTRGRFATAAEVPGDERERRAYDPSVLIEAPPIAPSGLLNRASVRAFNEVWYRKAPARRRDELQSIPAFWHPLDMVEHWYRVYGPRGFLQWQYAVPFGAEDTVRRTARRLSEASCTSFVNVLKRFGPANPGPLSFPMSGWTLAVDIPGGVRGLGRLLDELDEEVVAAGGRVYLAKDSRLRPELLPLMYPRLEEWRAVRERVDPDRRLRSDLAVRLGLV
jgi:decaprenylphospho-beta-D-ribofuranose 2-oxidase